MLLLRVTGGVPLSIVPSAALEYCRTSNYHTVRLGVHVGDTDQAGLDDKYQCGKKSSGPSMLPGLRSNIRML